MAGLDDFAKKNSGTGGSTKSSSGLDSFKGGSGSAKPASTGSKILGAVKKGVGGILDTISAPQQTLFHLAKGARTGDIGEVGEALKSSAKLAGPLGSIGPLKQDSLSFTETVGAKKLPYGLETLGMTVTDPVNYLTVGSGSAARAGLKATESALGAEARAAVRQGGLKALTAEEKSTVRSYILEQASKNVSQKKATKIADTQMQALKSRVKGGIGLHVPGTKLDLHVAGKFDQPLTRLAEVSPKYRAARALFNETDKLEDVAKATPRTINEASRRTGELFDEVEQAARPVKLGTVEGRLAAQKAESLGAPVITSAPAKVARPIRQDADLDKLQAIRGVVLEQQQRLDNLLGQRDMTMDQLYADLRYGALDEEMDAAWKGLREAKRNAFIENERFRKKHGLIPEPERVEFPESQRGKSIRDVGSTIKTTRPTKAQLETPSLPGVTQTELHADGEKLLAAAARKAELSRIRSEAARVRWDKKKAAAEPVFEKLAAESPTFAKARTLFTEADHLEEARVAKNLAGTRAADVESLAQKAVRLFDESETGAKMIRRLDEMGAPAPPGGHGTLSKAWRRSAITYPGTVVNRLRQAAFYGLAEGMNPVQWTGYMARGRKNYSEFEKVTKAMGLSADEAVNGLNLPEVTARLEKAIGPQGSREELAFQRFASEPTYFKGVDQKAVKSKLMQAAEKGRLIKHGGEKIRAAGSAVEESSRRANFLFNLENRYGNFAEAGAHTKHILPGVGAASQAEHSLGRVMPFWTAVRADMQSVMRLMAESPGRVNALADLASGIGGDPVGLPGGGTVDLAQIRERHMPPLELAKMLDIPIDLAKGDLNKVLVAFSDMTGGPLVSLMKQAFGAWQKQNQDVPKREQWYRFLKEFAPYLQRLPSSAEGTLAGKQLTTKEKTAYEALFKFATGLKVNTEQGGTASATGGSSAKVSGGLDSFKPR